MSDERVIKVSVLNKRIDELIKEYENEAEDRIQEYGDEDGASESFGKIKALQDLKIELNDPQCITDPKETVQQSLNLIEANNIINQPQGDQNT